MHTPASASCKELKHEKNSGGFLLLLALRKRMPDLKRADPMTGMQQGRLQDANTASTLDEEVPSSAQSRQFLVETQGSADVGV